MGQNSRLVKCRGESIVLRTEIDEVALEAADLGQQEIQSVKIYRIKILSPLVIINKLPYELRYHYSK